MTKKPRKIEQTCESLWAISTEGIIWQINPLNRSAAPVIHLDELSAEDRQSFERYVMRGLKGHQDRESIPDRIELFRALCLTLHRQP